MSDELAIDITSEQFTGVYANVVQISNNDYDYTFTFIVSEMQYPTSPAVCVARVRCSEKMAREFHVALGEHFSKLDTLRDINGLPSSE